MASSTRPRPAPRPVSPHLQSLSSRLAAWRDIPIEQSFLGRVQSDPKDDLPLAYTGMVIVSHIQSWGGVPGDAGAQALALDLTVLMLRVFQKFTNFDDQADMATHPLGPLLYAVQNQPPVNSEEEFASATNSVLHIPRQWAMLRIFFALQDHIEDAANELQGGKGRESEVRASMELIYALQGYVYMMVMLEHPSERPSVTLMNVIKDGEVQ